MRASKVTLIYSYWRRAAAMLTAVTIGILAGGIVSVLRAQISASATASSSTPAPLLRNVGIDQKLNDEVPLDLNFRDETGNVVALRQYFDQKPVILSLVYYECPMLCTEELN